MKVSKSILAVALLMGGMSASSKSNGRHFDIEDEFEPVVKPIPKGCKEYRFYGHTVVAINEK